MNTAGDAAEQVVRLSLESGEVALRLTGAAAKNIAAALYAVLKNRDRDKIKGRQRLSAMLKSGKELKVFSIQERRLKQFAAEAKRYGVVYCALRSKRPAADGLTDILVRAEDAAKINRIVERFHLAAVDAAVQSENAREEKEAVPDKSAAKADTDKEDEQLLDELLAEPEEQKAENAEPQEQAAPDKTAETSEKASLPEPSPETDIPQTPSPARMDTAQQDPPSGHTFAPPSKADAATDPAQRPSVRETLRDIIARRMAKNEQTQQPPKESTRKKTGKQTRNSATQSKHGHKHKNKSKQKAR